MSSETRTTGEPAEDFLVDMNLDKHTDGSPLPTGKQEEFLAAAWWYALIVLLAYSAVFCGGTYGFNDDYAYLYRVYTGTFDPAHNEQVGMGRPVASWLLNAAFGLCHGSVAHLVYVRGVALAGLIVFALVLHRGLARMGYTFGFICTVVLLVILSPACGVYAAWAAGFMSPVALTLCVMAGILLDDLPTGDWPRRMRMTTAFLLILLACGMWQAAAPMALFIGFARAWRCLAIGKRPWKGDLLRSWAVVGSSAIFYLVVQRLAVHFGWISSVGSERMALATDALGKMHLLGVLLRAGCSWWMSFHPGFGEWLCVGLMIVGVGFSLRVRSDGKSIDREATAWRAALAAVMLLASVSPLLVAGENNAAYRTLPILYATTAFLAVTGFREILRPRHERWMNWLGYGLIAVVAGGAYGHVRLGIVDPNHREYTGVRREIQRQFRQMPDRLVYLAPPPTLLGEDKLKASWEYGLMSSSFWWVTKPFLLLIFRELGLNPTRDPKPLEISFREADNPGVPVVNTLPILLVEGRWSDDPRFGRVQQFPRGWLYSPWLGYLNVSAWPVVQHGLLGSLLFIGAGPDDLWFHKDGVGEFLTSRTTYPNLYLSTSKDWVYLTDNDSAHCMLRDSTGHHFLVNQPSTGERGPTGKASTGPVTAGSGIPAFFAGEATLDNGVYYLKFGDREFGYYSRRDFPFIYHFDLGHLYFVDAHDLTGGCYLYDFKGSYWFYTNPSLYPYLYNFEAKAFYYYFAGTKNPRSFVNMNTREFIHN